MKILSIIILSLIVSNFTIQKSFATTTTTTDDQYEDQLIASETNSIADSICKAIALATGGIGISLFALILLVVGISVLQGKVSPGLFIGLAVGISVFFAAPSVLSLLSPSNKASGGCKCQTSKHTDYFYDSSGNKVEIRRNIPIDSNCDSTS